MLEVQWSLTRLGLTIIDNSGRREALADTPSTFPPHILREWAKRQALTQVVRYANPLELYEAVLDQLQQLRDKILDTDAINGFWNIHYQGNRIISRTPKHEPDIHPQIRLLLYDLDIQKGLQVTPEYAAGAGRLDFLLSGQTHTGQIINVCLEFKLAHAADLAHGILEQLPEYMARRSTDFGIYCVLDFGQEYRFDPNQFEIPNFDSSSTVHSEKLLCFRMLLEHNKSVAPGIRSQGARIRSRGRV
ncbi:MAG: hypothetical protein WBG50_11780, partial [Desulfomonilaceae bacterium]